MIQSNPQDVTRDEPGKTNSEDDGPEQPCPRQIGRYHIKGLLGKGGFGCVYLAHDEKLDRYVAVKLPHAKLIRHPDQPCYKLPSSACHQPPCLK